MQSILNINDNAPCRLDCILSPKYAVEKKDTVDEGSHTFDPPTDPKRQIDAAANIRQAILYN